MSSISAHRRIEQLTSQLCASKTSKQVQAQKNHKPVKVVVTGAAGQIAYSILFMIGQGKMLGEIPVELRLLDLPAMEKQLEGVVMELKDCAFPVLKSIIATSDYKTAFQDVDVALLIGAKPRGPGMQRSDLLSANAQIFAGQGKALDQYASRNVKVCVVGNPANTNCYIAMKNAPSLSPKCFSAMTRLDENRAKALIADKLKVNVSDVHNLVIYGNHSKTQVPCTTYTYIDMCVDTPSAEQKRMKMKVPARTCINPTYLDSEFMNIVQDRGAAIINARGKSSAASAANACVDHVRDWWFGTPRGQFVSMAIPSDGSYGIPKDLIFSFPCVCRNGEYHIIQNLPIAADIQKRIDITTKELLEEKAEAGFKN